jgi:hypothetical protein
VTLSHEASALVVHGDDLTYRVLVTPSTQCAGLAVVERTAAGFIVEELGGGSGDAEFDWLLISRKPATLGDTLGSVLPDTLPSISAPSHPAG